MISSAQAEAMQFKAHAADAAKSLVDIVDKIAKRAPQGVSGTESATKAHVETQMTAFETVAKATKAGVDYVDIQGKPRKTPKIGSVRKHP